MSELDDLRAYVRKRHDAATSKVSRMRRQKNVEVGGTKHDVRRDLSKIKHYNRKQLETYAASLNNFTSRDFGFVAGSEGVPLPRNKVRELETTQRRYNAKMLRKYDKVAEEFVPGEGLTLRQRDTQMRATRRVAQGEPAERAFNIATFDPKHITDVAALDKIINDLKKKSTAAYSREYNKTARGHFEEMLKVIGDPALTKEFKKVGARQFDLLWNYADGFTRDMGMKYAIAKLKAAGRKEAVHEAQEVNADDDIKGWIKWAQAQRPTGKRKS
jgi:hypothetical protein